jgi:hypothetical protein
MTVGVLVGLMSVLAVVAVYFWVIRSRPSEEQPTK